jgi:hypothetical protein
MAYLGNTSFASGLGGWRPINEAAAVATAIGSSAESPYSGSSFLRFQTSAFGGSVGIDFDPVDYLAYGIAGDSQTGYVLIPSPIYAQVVIRALPGAGQVSGELTFWELGLPSGGENHPRTAFSVGPEWTPVSVSIDRVGAGLHPWLRLEIYLTTLNVALDIGLVSVS